VALPLEKEKGPQAESGDEKKKAALQSGLLLFISLANL
jgi:hypothetical protein